MAIAKLNKKTMIKILVGLLIATNIGTGSLLAIKNSELKQANIDKQESIVDTKETIDKLIKENKDLTEKLSYKINSESDIRVIREDLIDEIKQVVSDKQMKVADIDILRALNSTEDRIMEEYIRVLSLILATMETETNFRHMVNENTNGTKDYGIMQVNDVIIPYVKDGLGEWIDPINNKDHNVQAGSYEIHECYLKAKEKHPEDVIWWTYAYYNRGMYFEGTDAWKNPNNPNYKKVHNQANVRSQKFKESYNAYYEALIALI